MIEKFFWRIEINRIEYKWNILLSCQLKSNLLSTQSKVPIQASTVRFEFVPKPYPYSVYEGIFRTGLILRMQMLMI